MHRLLKRECLHKKGRLKTIYLPGNYRSNNFERSETTGQSPQILFEQVGFESICKKIPKGVKMPLYEEGGYD